jgi:hypothetical protein
VKSILKASLCAGLLAGAGVAVYAADVHTDYDKHADFSRIHTYCWGKVSTDDPLYQNRIKDQVNKDLEGRGWQESQGGNCEATVFAKGGVHDQKELQTFYNGIGGGWGGGWGWGGWGWRSGWWGGPGGMGETTTTEVNKPVGSLVIDIFDNQSKNLIFRGIAQGDVSKNADKNTHNIDKDIDKMFDHFPPKK